MRTLVFAILILSTTLTPSVFGASITMEFAALIDGRSQLVVQGNTLQWNNLTYTVPGLHGVEPPGEPTIIYTWSNGTPVLVNEEWYPSWPSGTSGDVDSTVFAGLTPALPAQDLTALLIGSVGRESLSILEQPSAGNGYKLILDFDDNSTGGSAWYKATVKINYDDAAVPEPGTSMLILVGLVLVAGKAVLRRRSMGSF